MHHIDFNRPGYCFRHQRIDDSATYKNQAAHMLFPSAVLAAVQMFGYNMRPVYIYQYMRYTVSVCVCVLVFVFESISIVIA